MDVDLVARDRDVEASWLESGSLEQRPEAAFGFPLGDALLLEFRRDEPEDLGLVVETLVGAAIQEVGQS